MKRKEKSKKRATITDRSLIKMKKIDLLISLYIKILLAPSKK